MAVFVKGWHFYKMKDNYRKTEMVFPLYFLCRNARCLELFLSPLACTVGIFSRLLELWKFPCAVFERCNCVVSEVIYGG